MFDWTARGTRRPRWLTLLGLVAALALVAGACGSDDDDDAPDGGTPAAGATPTATATATPTPEPTIQARTFEALDSYRYEVVMTLAGDLFSEDLPPGLDLGGTEMELTVSGVRVNPDREHTHTVASLGFLSFTVEAITIGDEQWTRESGRAWSQSSADLPGGVPGDLDVRPGNVFGDDWSDEDVERLQALFDAHPYETETVNGLVARHYTFTAEEFAALFEGDDALLQQTEDLELSFDLWVSEEFGVPVRLLMVALTEEGAEAIRLTMDITDVNDSSLSVEPPDAE